MFNRSLSLPIRLRAPLVKLARAALIVALVWFRPPVPALAQSPADCPRQRLETATAEGLYLGRQCPDACYLVIRQDDGEELRLVDNLEEASGRLGRPGGRVRVSYDLVVAWNLTEGYCEDIFIFRSGRPAPLADGEPENPPAGKPEECPTEVLALEEAEGAYLGEVCRGGCEIVLRLDDGRELRLANDADRGINPAESLGRPGGRVSVAFERIRFWREASRRCEIRDRVVSGRKIEAAEEAAGPDPGYRW